MMGSLRSAAAKSLAYSGSDRFLLLEALFVLGATRLLILTVPFKRIAPHLGKQTEKKPLEDDQTPSASVQRIGWAVCAVAGHTPWESACLVQAIAAKWMLQRRRLPSTLYLGVAKDKDAPLQAHAWLRCQGSILTGASGHQRFTVIASFADG